MTNTVRDEAATAEIVEPPLFYSIVEARRTLGNISKTKIYNMLLDGTLVGKKLGGRTVIVGDSLRSLVDSLPEFGEVDRYGR